MKCLLVNHRQISDLSAYRYEKGIVMNNEDMDKAESSTPETLQAGSSLVPMLVSGLVLVVIGMGFALALS